MMVYNFIELTIFIIGKRSYSQIFRCFFVTVSIICGKPESGKGVGLAKNLIWGLEIPGFHGNTPIFYFKNLVQRLKIS